MSDSPSALTGLKILEYSQMVSGPYCAKILADLGAEVIKIEPPDTGDEARGYGPYPQDRPHPEKSGLFLYLNSNKLGITLDPQQPAGKELFLKLLADVDILIEDHSPAELSRLGLTYTELQKANPGLIMVSITPFGQTGPYADFKAYGLNICQASGESHIMQTGDLERPPLKTGGLLDDYDVGLTAAVSALGAYLSRELTGTGMQLDISKQEVLISLGRVDVVRYPNDGMIMGRAIQAVLLGGIMECRDGYVDVIAVQDKQWLGLMDLMENPAWGLGEECKGELQRAMRSAKLNARIFAWLKTKDKDYLYHGGQTRGVPLTAVYNAEDIVKSPQMAARDFFVEGEHPDLGRVKMPQGPYRFSESPWSLRRMAPRLGEHNREIYAARLKLSESELNRLREAGVI